MKLLKLAAFALTAGLTLKVGLGLEFGVLED